LANAKRSLFPSPRWPTRGFTTPAGPIFPRRRGRGSCSRLHRQVTAHCSSIPASTSRASRGTAWDHGRWPPVVNRAVVGRPGWRSARHPRPVVGRQLLHPGGRSARLRRPVVGRQLLRPGGRSARHPRPASLLASGSWPQGSRPAWDWPSSGLGVGPAPTSRAVCDMVLASVVWPGGLPCPWTRGRWTPWHATRGNRWSQRSRPCITSPADGAQGAGLDWWGACARGRACQRRPASSLRPGRGRESEAPPRGPLVESVLAVTRSDLLTIC
jgi:hypothetical protein